MSKGLLALLEPESKGDDSGAGNDEELDAMKDFLAAVGAKDPKAMKLAFARAFAACDSKDDEADDKEY